MELGAHTERYFVSQGSIVRRIWGKTDTVLVIFAGAAAEFALNKAVDWLYFTGKIPEDPIGRLFSTVAYAHRIIFSDNEEAVRALQAINHIHQTVEQARGAKIPDWAYRDVLYMLVDYSVRAFELLDRKLTMEEKQELFDVFLRMGNYMRLEGLPKAFASWENDRQVHLRQDLAAGAYTADLFLRYRNHLGKARYYLMIQIQSTILPAQPLHLLKFRASWPIHLLLWLYRLLRKPIVNSFVFAWILPSKYKTEVSALNRRSFE